MNQTVKTTLLALAIATAGASFAFAQTPTPGPKVIGHCTLENGVRRAAVKWEPKVTPPAPTATAPLGACVGEDGDFGAAPDNPQVLEVMGKTYEPGREYHFCATFPPGAQHVIALSSNNHVNGSCNIYSVTALSPSSNPGMMSSTASQPGSAIVFQPGKWKVSVILESDGPLTPLCAKSAPLDLFLAWY